ncbi:sodium:solute symporter family protein [candidate division KSB1 bacterium]|nr:sodium:solute symporter family protein [candidate division KSB1 bacterium]
MYILGLHFIDFSIILSYIFFILWLGKRAAEKTKDTDDFYLAGRKLGKFYQFFLNFGNSTNADQAMAVSREIYRQGIGGMWIQYLVLFLTPFYWFTTMLFRRSRFITIGDFFEERFRSKFLGGAFAIFTLVMAFIGGGVGYMVAGKTMMALTPKPGEKYSIEEKQSVEWFNSRKLLIEKENSGTELLVEEQVKLNELNERFKRGELKSFVSFINPVVFYFGYALIVAIYTMLGGFVAAAITDAIQGVLIIIFSILLIPIGLSRIGGFSGLHASVPDWMFELFGSTTMSEYAWYTILAMVIANLVSIVASAPMMATAGSAKDENTARFGMIAGMFFKRFIMIFWALAGLLAIGLFAGELHDPDQIWGFMTNRLLFPGAIGLMLAGILAANMSTLDASSVTHSALFIRNIYQPILPGKSEKHYLLIGRVVIAITLLGGIGTALFIGNLLDLFKYFIAIPAIFGAPIWLSFVWRGLTKWAVIIQVFICFAIYAIIPNLFQTLDWAQFNEKFLLETKPRIVTVSTGALNEDIEAGRASKIGESIQKKHEIKPTGVFFDKVALTDPKDPGSVKVGIGRFHAEIWVVSWICIDFTNFSKAQLVTTRFLFNALFPFLLLFILSIFTKEAPKENLDRFYGKLHTPVQPTPEKEQQALEYAYKHPEKFEKDKLFPGTKWEILKPSMIDLYGFGGSWLLVGLVLLLLWMVVSIG